MDSQQALLRGPGPEPTGLGDCNPCRVPLVAKVRGAGWIAVCPVCTAWAPVPAQQSVAEQTQRVNGPDGG